MAIYRSVTIGGRMVTFSFSEYSGEVEHVSIGEPTEQWELEQIDFDPASLPRGPIHCSHTHIESADD